MIEIKVNNELHQFDDHLSISQLISQLEIAENGIAIAVNQNIITKQSWDKTFIQNQDDLLIIKATQGG